VDAGQQLLLDGGDLIGKNVGHPGCSFPGIIARCSGPTQLAPRSALAHDSMQARCGPARVRLTLTGPDCANTGMCHARGSCWA
jgi:hypothetical protein